MKLEAVTHSLLLQIQVLIKNSWVGLAQWYRARLWGERSRFDAQSQQPEMTLGIVACK